VLAGVTRRSEGPKQIVHIEQHGDSYSLVWNQRTGTLELTTAQGRFVLRLGEEPSAKARAAYDARALPIRAIVTALDEVSRPPAAEDLQSVLAESNSRPLWCQGPSTTGYSVSTYATSGLLGLVSEWLGFDPVIGPVEWTAAFTGAELCEAARNRADLDCWNQHCTGCCAYEECATLCFDVWQNNGFFCAAASIMGHSCSQLPPPPPPPDGGGDGGGEGRGVLDPDPSVPGGGGGYCCRWINQSACNNTSPDCTVHWTCLPESC
jgi:hypothetical protein